MVKEVFISFLLISFLGLSSFSFAEDTMTNIVVNTEPKEEPVAPLTTDDERDITPKTVAAGVMSFAIWPGLGQAVNDSKGSKVATHVILGVLPVFRFFSGYDALVDRKKGYWKGRI